MVRSLVMTTRQFHFSQIEQLDLSLDQIALNSPVYSRFAFMLIDNSIELTINRHARHIFHENQMWAKLGSPKYDPSLVEDAQGKFFDLKAKLGLRTGLLDDATYGSILHLHDFRNRVYHLGEWHESILRSLASFYLEIACDVMLKYPGGGFYGGTNDQPSLRARKYVGNPRGPNQVETINSAWRRLKETVQTFQVDLINDLSKSVQQAITDFNESLDFLVTHHPDKLSRDEHVIDAQAWAVALTPKGRDWSSKNGVPTLPTDEYVRWYGANYKWTTTRDPIKSWTKRQRSITSERSRHRALEKYCSFFSQTEFTRDAVNRSAALLDGRIQHQFDVLRGK